MKMGTMRNQSYVRVGPVNLRTQLSPPLFSPLAPQNRPVFPIIHTPTTSMGFFIQ